MERGTQFYLTLATGFVAAGLLLSGLCIPGHLVFELKPYAQLVLQSGNLDNWTAESLNLNPVKFETVKDNYQQYLKANRLNEVGEDSSDDEDENSSESDSSESEEIESPLTSSRLKRMRLLQGTISNTDQTETSDDNRTMFHEINPASSDPISIAGTEESSESSESIEETLEEQLQGVPIDETVFVGLFASKVCKVSQSREEVCEEVSVMTGMQDIIEAVAFTARELTMQFWGNLRMEAMFSFVACVGGVVSLLASIKPCCDVEQTPFYMGVLCFFASGVLQLVSVIRIILILVDFRENLTAELNVTTELRMPLSVVLSGIGGGFALIAFTSLLLSNQCGITKNLYRLLHSKHESLTQNGNDVRMYNMKNGGQVINMTAGHNEEKVDNANRKPLLSNA